MAPSRWRSTRGTRVRSGGALVLVATPIGNFGDLSARAIATFSQADEIWCEDTRRTRVLLNHAGIDGVKLRAVHEHNEAAAAVELVEKVASGLTIAYASDAGMPGVSDPGERLVAACAASDLAVSVVPGPSAAISALVISGLPSNRFVFEGFIARKGTERKDALARIASSDATSILYESPNRIAATIADLADACGPDRPGAVVRELTKIYEEVVRGPLAELISVKARGECVILIAAASPKPIPTDADIDSALLDGLADGLSARDAANSVAKTLSVSKNRAYERATAIKSSKLK